MKFVALLVFFAMFSAAAAEALQAPQSRQPQAEASPAPSRTDGFTELQQLLKMRDPFKRMVVVETVRKVKSALETFPADSYKMIGVLTGPDRLRAMLIDPDGKTHIVSENMKIGTHEGVIRRIYSDHIVVRERFANIFGQLENFDQEIKLEAEKRPAATAADAGGG